MTATHMFLLDSLLLSGLRWTLDTIRTAADRQMYDEGALRDRLLEAEMRRELGDIDDETFRVIESDVVAQIRSIRARRASGAGAGSAALEMTAGTSDRTLDAGVTVEAILEGDFHEAAPEETGDRAPAPTAGARGHARRRPHAGPADRPARRPAASRRVRRGPSRT